MLRCIPAAGGEPGIPLQRQLSQPRPWSRSQASVRFLPRRQAEAPETARQPLRGPFTPRLSATSRAWRASSTQGEMVPDGTEDGRTGSGLCPRCPTLHAAPHTVDISVLLARTFCASVFPPPHGCSYQAAQGYLLGGAPWEGTPRDRSLPQAISPSRQSEPQRILSNVLPTGKASLLCCFSEPSLNGTVSDQGWYIVL